MGLVPSRRAAVGVIALAVLAALPVVAQAATAEVTVSGFVKPLNTDLQAFYPSRTFVHQGDSVRFVIRGTHNVTFLGGRKRPVVIVPTGAANPPTNDAAGAPFWWAGTPELHFDSRVALPAGGHVESGTQFLASGVPQGPKGVYTVRFPKVGTFKYICSVHAHMAGQVTVVPRRGAVPSAADARALGAAELAADRAAATALARKERAKPSASSTVTIGPGTDRLTSFRFFPRSATVPAGTVVTFKYGGGNEPVHTVTFGTGPVFDQLGMTFLGPPPQLNFSGTGAYPTDPPGSIPAVTADAHGNGLVNSGVITAPGIPGPEVFKVRFPNPGTYEYVCFFHEDMFGKIVVT